MTYWLNIGLLGLAIYAIWLWSKHFPLKKFLFYTLIIKLLAGIFVTAIYLYYYREGDMLYMFRQGELLRTMLLDSPTDFWKFPHTGVPLETYYLGEYKDLNPRLIFFVKIVAFINLLTFNSLWLTALWFSLFSFLGFWYCANVLARLFPESKVAIIFSFLVCPSTVFWSAGLLKESLLCSAICVCVGIFLSSKNSFFTKISSLATPKIIIKALIFFLCLYLILQIKYYYLAALLPTLFAYTSILLLQKYWKISPFGQVFGFFVFFFFIAFLASFTHPNFHLNYFLIALSDSHEEVMTTTDADNLIYLNDFQPSLWSLVLNIPNALFASLLEPLLWEVGGHLPKLLAAGENIFLYCIFIFTAQISLKWHKNSLLLLVCVVYIAILATLLAVSMPSIGTLVRYKVGFLPFWTYLLTYRLGYTGGKIV
jgi:hypothetical protein